MKRKLGLFAVLGLILAACGGNNGGGPNPPPPSGPNTITGLVTDIGSGARLAGVQVSVVGGSPNTTTDAKGEFILSGLPQGRVNLALSKANYAPGYASADSGDSAQAVIVALKKGGAPQSYNPTQARTLYERTEAGPYAVIFQPNSLDTSDTNLKVVITPLDPTKEDAALPGDLIAGGATPLAAVTFAEFSILDSSGKKVNLKSGSSAIVELPIPPELRGQYPLGAKIHCYAYNPQTGRWEDFVEGTVETSSVDGTTPVLRASIRHFSWYGGAPQVQDQTCVAVDVTSKLTGKPLEGAVITARPGLRSVSGKDGFATITVQKGVPVKFFATKTYTDTYVDDKGNLVPKKGAKVIEIGRVEESELTPLVMGPCQSSSSQRVGAMKGEQGNPVRIQLGLAPDATYKAFAMLTAGQGVLVTLEKGFPDEEGELQDPEPASGAKLKLSNDQGQSADLSEVGAGSGLYSLQGGSFPIQAGRLYTLSIDGDGNGTLDGSGSTYAVGTVAWDGLANGGSYSASTLEVKWTDSGGGQTGYNALYYCNFFKTDPDPDMASYVGSQRSFQPRSSLADPPVPLKPGSYAVTLIAFSGAFSGSSPSNFTISDNITGVGVQGQFMSFASADPLNITLTSP
ncbi:MAG TPA: carboxypeptidase regulatory-like domain-containing protein [Meiothermus sp.]|nr:carboxypeptidase regulatory-like domain-containing protein [Meiothermus sp.]